MNKRGIFEPKIGLYIDLGPFSIFHASIILFREWACKEGFLKNVHY